MQKNKYLNPDKYYRPHLLQEKFHTANLPFIGEKRPLTEMPISRVYYGANQSGKTRGGIIEDFWWAFGVHPYFDVPIPTYGWIVSPDFSQSRSAIQGHKGADKKFAEFTKWLEKFKNVRHKGKKITWEINRNLHTVVFSSGSAIEFKSCKSGELNFAGAKLDWIHFDEPPDKDIFDECLVRLLSYAGHYWMTMTALSGVGCWTYDEIFEQRGKPIGKLTNKVGNPAMYFNEDADRLLLNPSIYDNVSQQTGKLNISEKHVKLMELTFDQAKRSIRLNGWPALHEGLVFGDVWKPEKHIVDAEACGLQEGIPDSWIKGRGIDFGATELHPWVCIWAAMSPAGVWYLYDEYTSSQGNTKEHATAVKLRHEEEEYKATVTDPKGKERIITLARNGIPTIKGAADPEGRVDTIRELLATEKLFVLRDKCPTFVSNMTNFQWPPLPKRANTVARSNPKPVYKDNDAIDAAGYLLQHLHWIKPPEGTSAENMEEAELVRLENQKRFDKFKEKQRLIAQENYEVAPYLGIYEEEVGGWI